MGQRPRRRGASVTVASSCVGARDMNLLDLIKATIACGLSAFLIYSFPVVSQVVIIGGLSLLWLSYAHRTLVNLLRR